MRRLLSIALCFVLALAPGCRSRQLACDQNKMRSEVLSLYENQIMDNLIRTDQGLPIVQMDYTQIVGTITQNGTTGVTDAYTQTATNSLAGIVRTITHTFTNVFTFNATGYETAVLTVTANPLINNNEVYNSYIRFVQQTPSPLVQTCDPPPPGAAHICRKCGKVYYWIPSAYKDQFFRLALATTVMRPAVPPDYFDNTVADAQAMGIQGTMNRIAVKFNTAMQNGSGTMDAAINGVVCHFPLYMYSPPLDAPAPMGASGAPPGTKTVWFVVIYDQNSIPLPQEQVVAALKAGNLPVKVYLDFFKPASSTTQALQTIQSDTQQIRIQGQSH